MLIFMSISSASLGYNQIVSEFRVSHIVAVLARQAVGGPVVSKIRIDTFLHKVLDWLAGRCPGE